MDRDIHDLLRLIVDAASVGTIAWGKLQSATPIFSRMVVEQREKLTPEEWDIVVADADAARDRGAAEIEQARNEEAGTPPKATGT